MLLQMLVYVTCCAGHVNEGRRHASTVYLDRATLEEAPDHHRLSRGVFADHEACAGYLVGTISGRHVEENTAWVGGARTCITRAKGDFPPVRDMISGIRTSCDHRCRDG